jgi:DNA-binding winged helix-turn-helix (wHTH) protein
MTFSGVKIYPGARLVVVDKEQVKIGARAFDLLVLLAMNKGSVVSKSRAMAFVWRDVHVGDGSLRLQVHALRKALNSYASAIKSISGQGYMLVDSACIEASDPRPNSVALILDRSLDCPHP